MTSTSLPKSSLLQGTAQYSWSQVVAWFARHCDAARLDWVLELTVAASRSDEAPAVLIEHCERMGHLLLQLNWNRPPMLDQEIDELAAVHQIDRHEPGLGRRPCR